MSDDPEQNQQVDASPSTTRIQTPLLNRFLTAAASPAVSLKNFGKGRLLRLRTDGTFPTASPSIYRKEDIEAVDRIDEEEIEDEETQCSETPTSDSYLRVPHRHENLERQRNKLPQITVLQASTDNISLTDQPSG